MFYTCHNREKIPQPSSTHMLVNSFRRPLSIAKRNELRTRKTGTRRRRKIFKNSNQPWNEMKKHLLRSDFKFHFETPQLLYYGVINLHTTPLKRSHWWQIEHFFIDTFRWTSLHYVSYCHYVCIEIDLKLKRDAKFSIRREVSEL